MKNNPTADVIKLWDEKYPDSGKMNRYLHHMTIADTITMLRTAGYSVTKRKRKS